MYHIDIDTMQMHLHRREPPPLSPSAERLKNCLPTHQRDTKHKKKRSKTQKGAH